jgi:hypothetical protein
MSNLGQFASEYGGAIVMVVVFVVVFVAWWRWLLSPPSAGSGGTYNPYDRDDTSRRGTVNGRAPE